MIGRIDKLTVEPYTGGGDYCNACRSWETDPVAVTVKIGWPISYAFFFCEAHATDLILALRDGLDKWSKEGS